MHKHNTVALCGSWPGYGVYFTRPARSLSLSHTHTHTRLGPAETSNSPVGCRLVEAWAEGRKQGEVAAYNVNQPN